MLDILFIYLFIFCLNGNFLIIYPEVEMSMEMMLVFLGSGELWVSFGGG